MQNYCKGKNVELPLEKEHIPIENLAENFIWMQVRGGSKIRNLLSHALEEFPKERSLVWTGFGQAVGKAISCAEIMKREHKNKLYQITRICYRSIEEYWDPLLEGLDQMVVKRQLPMIHILLSMDPLDSEALGYQAPNAKLSYISKSERPNSNKRKTNFSNKNKPRKSTSAPLL